MSGLQEGKSCYPVADRFRTAGMAACGLLLAIAPPTLLAQDETPAKSGAPAPAASLAKAPASCTNPRNQPIRFWMLYTNAVVDSGTWYGQGNEIHDTDSNDPCLEYADGDSVIDAATIHLSCSVDYFAEPTAVGNGLTVEDWAFYRPGFNGGVCGSPFPGTLIIEKQTDPDGSQQSFGFTSPSGDIGAFSLQDGGTESFFIPSGTYDVTETEVGGWALTGISCTDPTGDSSVDVASNTATAVLGQDETVTCVFTNTEMEANPSIDIEKATNGQDADAPTGPIIVIGNPVNWTYAVTNTGDVALSNVSVTDDQGVTVSCPKTSLDVGESMTCTASGVASAGQYANVGTAEGTPGEGTVSDSDPSHYFGAPLDLAISKTDGGLAFVAEGGSLVYTLTYENLGDVDLTGVVINDTVPVNTTFDSGTSTAGWSCADGAPAGAVCTIEIGPVAAGGSGQVLFGLSVDELWEPDPQTGLCPPDPSPVTVDNTATVTDDGSMGADGKPSNNTSSDDTPVSVQCEDLPQGSPDINIEKTPDSQQVEIGGTASFTIEVTNTGTVNLVNVTVTDPQAPDCDNFIGDLAVGASVSYSCERTNVQEGFNNVATVTGEGEEGGDVTDDDDAVVFLLDEPPQMHQLVPTLSQWAVILMAALVLFAGMVQARKWTRR